MLRSLMMGMWVVCALVFGMPTIGAYAPQTTAQQDAKKAGQEAKEAGKEAGQAAKDAGKATAKGTKRVVKKTGQVTEAAAKETGKGIKKAAKTVKRKLTPNTTSATCNDGTVQTGKTKTTACVDHGGVKG